MGRAPAAPPTQQAGWTFLEPSLVSSNMLTFSVEDNQQGFTRIDEVKSWLAQPTQFILLNSKLTSASPCCGGKSGRRRLVADRGL